MIFKSLEEATAAGLTRESWRQQWVHHQSPRSRKKGIPVSGGPQYDRLDRIKLCKAVKQGYRSSEFLGVKRSLWAAGIYTGGKRATQYLRTTVASLLLAGWPELVVFAEPGTPIDREIEKSVRVIRWPQKLGEFRNFTSSWQALLDMHPEAERVLLCQDDIVCGQDLCGFLNKLSMPDMTSLYTPSHYSGAGDGILNIGFERFGDGGSLWGSLAFAFKREVVVEMLKHPEVIYHSRDRGSDFVMGRFAAATRRRIRYFQPSLVQHIGHDSALPHGGATGKRKASKFVGQDAGFVELRDLFLPPFPNDFITRENDKYLVDALVSIRRICR